MIRFTAHVWGEGVKDAMTYSPSLLAARGFWVAAMVSSNVGTYSGAAGDIWNDNYGNALAKIAISEFVITRVVDSAQLVPGGRVFGAFYYASEAALGEMIDARK